jgi:hypothetical protein
MKSGFYIREVHSISMLSQVIIPEATPARKVKGYKMMGTGTLIVRLSPSFGSRGWRPNTYNN